MMRLYVLFGLIILVQACQPVIHEHKTFSGESVSINASDAHGSSNERAKRANEGSDENTKYQQKYTNEEYGYSVEVPKELTSVASPPPAPNHGVKIVLPQHADNQNGAYIWTDGSYNVGELRSSRQAVNEIIESRRGDAENFSVNATTQPRLQDLEATRVVLQYRNKNSKETVIEDITSAIREGQGEGVIYTVGLVTEETRYERDKQILEQVLKSWRAMKLPE